jgi:ferredoxin/flavodoxin---NADP+ reductase
MFQILDSRQVAPKVKWFRIQAPRVAKNRKAGQFVILRLDDRGERIPLTIADVDRKAGTIDLFVQAIGATTEQMCRLNKGDAISNVAGPLGQPTEIENFGHAVLVGGGVGTAVIYPQAAALREAGNVVSAVIGGRSKEYVILEDELKNVCDNVYPCTDDGSYGYKGFVTGKLEDLIKAASPKVGAVLAAGPVPMMKNVCKVTQPYGIKTIVSLNPIMVDGTGMCGGCRVTVGGKTKFACVDGPEFDGHQVDFVELSDRLTTYRKHEADAVKWFQDHQCKLDAAAGKA